MGSIGCKLWIVSKDFHRFGNTTFLNKKGIMPNKFMLFIKYIKRVQLTVGVYISVTTTTLIHMCDTSLPQIRHNGTMGGRVINIFLLKG